VRGQAALKQVYGLTAETSARETHRVPRPANVRTPVRKIKIMLAIDGLHLGGAEMVVRDLARSIEQRCRGPGRGTHALAQSAIRGQAADGGRERVRVTRRRDDAARVALDDRRDFRRAIDRRVERRGQHLRAVVLRTPIEGPA